MLPIQSAGTTLPSPIAYEGLGQLSSLDTLAIIIGASSTVLPRPSSELSVPSATVSEGHGQLIVFHDPRGSALLTALGGEGVEGISPCPSHLMAQGWQDQFPLTLS